MSVIFTIAALAFLCYQTLWLVKGLLDRGFPLITALVIALSLVTICMMVAVLIFPP